MNRPQSTNQLDEWLSRPTDSVRDVLSKLDGDILVLGAAGKMGPTLARMARRSLPESRQVIAVSRFGNPETAAELEQHGIRTIRCDLLNRDAVAALPDAPNVIYMAGTKFGTSDRPELTWMMNAIVPSIVAERFKSSRIVMFSTGCVYSMVDIASGGSVETDALAPPGEYAHSCVARERVFTHYSKQHDTPLLLYRLNYAIDLRYGVLHDVATRVIRGEPVDVSMGYVNVIWQGDANARALQCLAHTASPPAIMNVTGRELIPVRQLAERFGELFHKPPTITGTETNTAWLSNAAKSFELFGDITVTLDEMIHATADWIQRGGISLGKPTHFETRDGMF
ncbi:MAG: NAD-dependent epimerase/dehydratase family protein [Planctomycetaceae bacterium]